MATRRPGASAFRPATEGLEPRELLSNVVRGVDIDGDQWTLRLVGPGDVRVVSTDGEPFDDTVTGLIDTITIAGAQPQRSQLVGKVRRAAGGDGRVFFRAMREIGSRPQSNEEFQGNGVHAIDMPDFWLGYTLTDPPPNGTPGLGTPAALIHIPDGVNTLRFGGADTTFTPPGGTPLDQDETNTLFQINLGLPLTIGTSIIVDRVVTGGQAPATTTGTATQDTVVFNVTSRLNLFQANEIAGNAALPPAQFGNINENATATRGGTYVISGSGTAPFGSSSDVDIEVGSAQGGLTGQIGNIRIGGDVTNFTAMVFDASQFTGGTGALISNFSIGGETTNVLVSAPNGARNVAFGLGMDTVELRTQTIAHLRANRGALNSQVVATGQIQQMILGGDVVGTRVLSGYDQNFTVISNNLRGPTPSNPTPVPATPPEPTSANSEGSLRAVLVAGDVIDSLFAASVQSFDGLFGTDSDLELGQAIINAKIEGTINNADNLEVAGPNQAFFARNVHLARGPVRPPIAPQPPYPPTREVAPHAPRVAKHLQPTSRNR